MRFFESVKKCLWEDTFKYVSSNMKDSDIPEEKYGKDYVEFINELLHYVKIGIQSAPAKYIDHRYDECHLAVLFEYFASLTSSRPLPVSLSLPLAGKSSANVVKSDAIGVPDFCGTQL